MYGMDGFGMFSIMEVFFPIMFLLVFGIIIFTIIRGLREWDSNNKQPILNVNAKLISKRTSTSRHNHSMNNGHNHISSSTSYYVTFEVNSGDRMEFKVSGKEYGMLAEGDTGELIFQGSRYHRFNRES